MLSAVFCGILQRSVLQPNIFIPTKTKYEISLYSQHHLQKHFPPFQIIIQHEDVGVVFLVLLDYLLL